MKLTRSILIASVLLALVGLSVAVFLNDRDLGKFIFMVGFFGGAVGAIWSVISRPSFEFGKTGPALKVVAGGFGVIVVGELLTLALDLEAMAADSLFYLGMGVIVLGISMAGARTLRK